MPQVARKIERFDFRMSEEDRSLFETAAEISGQTLTSYLLSNMKQISQNIIKSYTDSEEAKKEIQQKLLSKRDSKRFIELLEDNSEPNKALKSAYARYRKLKNK